MNDNDKPTALESALREVERTPYVLAHELRRMARGENPYRCFFYTQAHIKNVWRAAADLIENYARSKTPM